MDEPTKLDSCCDLQCAYRISPKVILTWKKLVPRFNNLERVGGGISLPYLASFDIV